jgi:DNA-binding transcriptional ArsR family regulator
MLNQADQLDRVFHALADPSRRLMVERLGRGPASVSELARPLTMTLAAVVQHLQVLEASGLVRTEKVGRVRTCRIEPAALRTAERWISERRSGYDAPPGG